MLRELSYITASTCVLLAAVIGMFAMHISIQPPSPPRNSGLVIVAHGAPSFIKGWNEPVLALEEKVQRLLQQERTNPFAEIRVAIMEFREPSLRTVIGEMKDQGIGKVLVLPLFVTESSHTLGDLPIILGIYADDPKAQQIQQRLFASGVALVEADIDIERGPTLDYKQGALLIRFIGSQLQKFAQLPGAKGVLLLVHGDVHYPRYWHVLCRRIGRNIEKFLPDMEEFAYEFVAHGNKYRQCALDAIRRLQARSNIEQVIVVGAFISMSVEQMNRSTDFTAANVHFSTATLIDSPLLAPWLVDIAQEWHRRQPGKDALDAQTLHRLQEETLAAYSLKKMTTNVDAHFGDVCLDKRYYKVDDRLRARSVEIIYDELGDLQTIIVISQQGQFWGTGELYYRQQEK